MSDDQTQQHDPTDAPPADVMQRVADALESTETGEAATLTQTADSDTPLLPRRGG